MPGRDFVFYKCVTWSVVIIPATVLLSSGNKFVAFHCSIAALSYASKFLGDTNPDPSYIASFYISSVYQATYAAEV